MSNRQFSPVSIPSIGLALMAGRLADGRVPFGQCSSVFVFSGDQLDPVERVEAEMYPDDYPASAEYYKIIDRISRGKVTP